MHGGGIRSLVATAMAVSESDKPARGRIALLHLADGRFPAARRAEHVKRHAGHFGITKLYELPLGTAPTTVSLRLAAAIAQAVELGAERLVWPAQYDGDVRLASRATELSVLVTQLAETEAEPAGSQVPRLDTPLAELTDHQIIDLGGSLDVPWGLAWSCLTHHDTVCRTCEGCRRRDRAFAAAGVLDPLLEPAGALR